MSSSMKTETLLASIIDELEMMADSLVDLLDTHITFIWMCRVLVNYYWEKKCPMGFLN